jgi:hypothetical protein
MEWKQSVLCTFALTVVQLCFSPLFSYPFDFLLLTGLFQGQSWWMAKETQAFRNGRVFA